MAALAELAAVPFLDNELFMLIRALHRLLLSAPEQGEEEEEGKTTSSRGTTAAVAPPGGDAGKICENPEACLESVLTSRAFRTLAEQSMDRGLDGKAAAFLDEAIGQMEAFLEEPHRLPRPSKCAVFLC